MNWISPEIGLLVVEHFFLITAVGVCARVQEIHRMMGRCCLNSLPPVCYFLGLLNSSLEVLQGACKA